MMPFELIFPDRKCGKCENQVAQLVSFNTENDEIKIGTQWENCVVCKAFLPKPTDEETDRLIDRLGDSRLIGAQNIGAIFL